MVTKKTTKKKVTKKKSPVKTKNLGQHKVHVVLGEDLMKDVSKKCDELKMSKSEVGRILFEYLVTGSLRVIPAKVVKSRK